MSRIAPQMARERIVVPPRPSVSPAARARVLARSDGRCAYPGCASTLALEVDHVIARELGGKDDEANYLCLCRDHHRKKTALDRKLIAKAHRLIAREDGTRRVRRPIASPGWRTDVRQKLDGTIERIAP